MQDDDSDSRLSGRDEHMRENTMPDHTIAGSQSASTRLKMSLSLAALGVVFGDIGTSPLYTLKTVLDVTGGAHSDPATVLGALSLILWTLIIVTSLKYVTFALRVDNCGEGGILALMALLRRMHGRWQPFLAFIGLFGAALVYGDATITPAISVMSALEGLDMVAPHLQRYVLPGTVLVLVALFAVQRRGTARIGRLFGPIMLIWFVTIALLGVWGIAQHPAVLWALNPIVGLRYLFSGGGVTTLLVVGGVFLCVTGAEVDRGFRLGLVLIAVLLTGAVLAGLVYRFFAEKLKPRTAVARGL